MTGWLKRLKRVPKVLGGPGGRFSSMCGRGSRNAPFCRVYTIELWAEISRNQPRGNGFSLAFATMISAAIYYSHGTRSLNSTGQCGYHDVITVLQ